MSEAPQQNLRRTAGAASGTDACPDANLLLRFTEGLLDEPQARELEAHIARCDECRQLLGELGAEMEQQQLSALPTQEATTDARGADDSSAGGGRSALLGTVLNGSYRLERFIGRGGMGAVYAASHMRLPRPLAVKLLATHLQGDDDAVQRLQREAEISARLRHPNIVEVIDFNVSRDGAPYIVMELLSGESLNQRLKQVEAITSLSELAQLLGQIVAGLAAAHDQGVVHRDLKPTNIFLCSGPAGADLVKVMDFGISKLLSDTGGELTAHTAMLGSPAYMSPEQARGQSAAVDVRADIFSLGAVVFRMLSGASPFGAKSVPDTLYRVVHTSPRATPRWNALSKPIRRAVLHALRKKPRDRPASVRQFWDELSGALRLAGCADVPEPFSPQSPGTSEGSATALPRTARPAPSWRWPVFLALGLLLAGAGGLALASLWGPAQDAARSDSTTPASGPAPLDAQVAVDSPGADLRPAPDRGRPVPDAASRSMPDSRASGPPAARPVRAPRKAPPRRRRPAWGGLVIQSKDQATGRYVWATAHLDGRRVGMTPVTLRRLRAGRHRVTLSRPGFHTVTRTIRVRGGRLQTISLPLRAR